MTARGQNVPLCGPMNNSLARPCYLRQHPPYAADSSSLPLRERQRQPKPTILPLALSLQTTKGSTFSTARPTTPTSSKITRSSSTQSSPPATWSRTQTTDNTTNRNHRPGAPTHPPSTTEYTHYYHTPTQKGIHINSNLEHPLEHDLQVPSIIPLPHFGYMSSRGTHRHRCTTPIRPIIAPITGTTRYCSAGSSANPVHEPCPPPSAHSTPWYIYYAPNTLRPSPPGQPPSIGTQPLPYYQPAEQRAQMGHATDQQTAQTGQAPVQPMTPLGLDAVQATPPPALLPIHPLGTICQTPTLRSGTRPEPCPSLFPTTTGQTTPRYAIPANPFLPAGPIRPSIAHTGRC
ncbi:hypothetical protein H257_01788 [Aphanomyces astaci]|uniref:Uncharacterized protein n=1 Tax=Aphanomyces astaci TaxID=112090 RepID=W4H6B9_APHAT|nr:hypothetical protein H257_01788 [Aphanomyces astaci]ETV86663.1 hypothetical protein H257_01788 [Aphanomyces astaci]|eukprot:XP_009823462.1 hypothetical protein H257_01788 [Aphanomyces astaci]